MLTTLLLTGLGSGKGPAQPPVDTPAERTITFTKLGGNFAPQQQLDPTDVMDFLLNLTPLLDESEAFLSVDIRVVAQSQLHGFIIMDEAPFAPVVVGNGRVQIWCTIKPENRNSSQWAKGTLCQVEVTATTTLQRTWQRTAQITAVNK